MMTETDPFYNSRQECRKKCDDLLECFEEHFTWLEEVVAEARKTFAFTDPTLLPKTPSTKKTSQKRPRQAVKEVIECTPPKRPSDGKSEQQTPPQTPPRRGRAASRLALERTKQQFKNENARKLRRPSTPVPTTTKKNSGKRALENCQLDDKENLQAHDGNENGKNSHQSESMVSKTSEYTEERVPEVSLKNLGVDKLDNRKQVLTPRHFENIANINTIEKTPVPEGEWNDFGATQKGSDDEADKEFSSGRSEVKECKGNQEIDSCLKLNKARGLQPSSEIVGSVNSAVDRQALTATESIESLDIQSLEEVKVLESSGKEQIDVTDKSRSTRTKQKGKNVPSSSEEDVNDVPYPVPKPRTTRTKQRIESALTENSVDILDGQMLPPLNAQKPRATRTKVKTKEQETPDTVQSVSADIQSKQEKGEEDLHKSTDSHNEASKAPSSHTEQKKSKDVDSTAEERETSLRSNPDVESSDSSRPAPRLTRTKRRQAEEQCTEKPTRVTRTKRRKVDSEETVAQDQSFHLNLSGSEDEVEPSNYDANRNKTSVKSDSSTKIKHDNNSEPSEIHYSASDTVSESAETTGAVRVPNQPLPSRVTRSKVRQVVTSPKKSPQKLVNQNIMSPKTPIHKTSNSEAPKTARQVRHRPPSPKKFSPRINGCLQNASSIKGRGKLNAVVETASELLEEIAHSPTRIIRLSRGKMVKSFERRENSTERFARKSLKRAINTARRSDAKRAKLHYETPDSHLKSSTVRTPSPVSLKEKIIRLKPGYYHHSGSAASGSSGRVTPKAFSRIRSGLTSSSSNEYNKTQKRIISNTPNESKRTKNIITGVSSFINVQPSKPTREDLEAKRQVELQKKMEREEESRRKKEEILKSKAEDQKRRNEERMRRVQEAREEREKKVQEAKEQQERERRQREERLKEEQRRKKQQLLAKKKAEEEAKARKIQEQVEEEERRAAEEARKAEEARRLEEDKRTYLAEQRRLQEEERKRRLAEEERVAREKKELELLRIREAERIAAAKQAKLAGTAKKVALNETYNNEDKENSSALNNTYTKPKEDPSNPTRSHSDDNNYDIRDIGSDDSTDEEGAPRKKIPFWAKGTTLKALVVNQEYYPPAIQKIFPPEELLLVPDLSKIFTVQRKRFQTRTSSACWNTPPSKLYETYYTGKQ